MDAVYSAQLHLAHFSAQLLLMRMTTSVPRRGLQLALAAGVMFGGAAQAQTTVYKCVDAQGRVEFTDTGKKGCKALDLPGYIPAPPARVGPAPAARASNPAPAAAAASPSVVLAAWTMT